MFRTNGMPRAQGCAGAAHVQDKVRPGTGREGALGYERYVGPRQV
jgi:hypothetical protein